MKRPSCFVAGALLLLAWLLSSGTEAAVIVLANRTDKSVLFAVISSDNEPQGYQIAAGDVLPLPVRRQTTIRFNTDTKVVDRTLPVYSIGSFVRNGQLDLVEQHFSGAGDAALEPPSASSPGAKPLDFVAVFPVMILVDDDEPAVRRLWESRLRRRVEAASDIFERHCRMRFEVVAVDTWESTDGVTDFALTLREFERQVHLKQPARLAIGFTSQYKKPEKRRVHLGGTRGPLYPYLLVREWSQHISEPERLEVLVHELGHVFGASHSAESVSVMRPLVGDRQSRARSFRIGFDSLNTLSMYVLCEQLRLHGVKRLDQFSPASLALLSSIYQELGQRMSGDTSAARYLMLIERASQRQTRASPFSLTFATQSVVRAVTRAARENHARPAETASPSGSATRLDGDALAEYYIRTAGQEVRKLPERIAAKAFLLGLAVALDNSEKMDETSILHTVYRRYETPRQRQQRLAVLGKPTAHQRHDLLQHFVTSAALCVMVGNTGAESLSTLKEISDSQTGSGFSFADLAADLAGITFATRLQKSELAFDDIARSFEIRHFLLPPGTIPEGISHGDFTKTYGNVSDPRFRQQRESLCRQLLALPGYANQEQR
ncbi:MAG: hypothetical protein JW888_04150 [Pirellulales bacterium]|nr:hypothetical protein [Pirellulales bacterium]